MKTITVIGNGPSLREFDFSTLGASDTLGMNAAYRYWERVNWYPTHYCCLDPELIATHHTAIWALIAEERVKTAFLHGDFLEFFPDAVRDKRFVFLNQFSRNWYGHFGERYGLPFIESRAFYSSQSAKVTAGAYAVRYVIYLGYQRIGLLGIDLRYIEQIPEAMPNEDLQLVMEQTPKHNPNYFFDDYQREGDRSQVLNPEVHNFDLHPASFETLRDDLVQQRLGVSIVNCSRQSELHARGIFPYRSLGYWLGQQQLDALVILTQVREGDRILKMLELWQQPAFVPFLHFQEREKVKLIFTFTGEADVPLQSSIRHLYESSTLLQRCFHPPEFHFFVLPVGEDVYIKDGAVPLGKKGFASGPNQQFFRTLFALHEACNYALFMETDCLPLRPDWLGALCEQVQTLDEFWVMGSHYRGKLAMFKHFARHINGVAVYAVGDSKFIEFAREWEAILDHVVAHQNPVVAYDSVLEYFFYYEFMNSKGSGKRLNPNSKGWKLFQGTAAYFRYTDYILNFSDATDQDVSGDEFLRAIRIQYDQAYLIHHKALCEDAYRWVSEHSTTNRLFPNSSSFEKLSTSLPSAQSYKQESQFENLAEEDVNPPSNSIPATSPSQPIALDNGNAQPISAATPISMLKSIIHAFSRKTLAIAFLAIAFNTIGSIEMIPYHWIFTASGTTFILLLIGWLLRKVSDIAKTSDRLQSSLKKTR